MKNKFLSVAASTAIVASALVFTGCGDSDSSSTSTSTSSSSSSSSSGGLSGQLLKGLIDGVPYNTTTTSGTTGVNGTFTYNANDNIGFSFGQLNVTVTNASSATWGNTSSIFPVGKMTSLNTGATVSGTEIDNIVRLFAMHGVSESTTNSSGIVAKIIAGLQKVDVGTYNMSEQMTTSKLSNVSEIIKATQGTTYNASKDVGIGTGIANYTQALNTYYASTAVNLTNQSLSNKMLLLSNGYYYQFNYTWGGATTHNTNDSAMRTAVESAYQASGSRVRLNQTNPNNVINSSLTFWGNLTAGTRVTIANANASLSDATITAVLHNLNATADGLGFTNTTRTLNLGGSTYTFIPAAGTNLPLGNYTINGSAPWGTSAFNITANGTLLALGNTTTELNNSAITAEGDITQTGTIARIWGSISDDIDNFFTNVWTWITSFTQTVVTRQ